MSNLNKMRLETFDAVLIEEVLQARAVLVQQALESEDTDTLQRIAALDKYNLAFLQAQSALLAEQLAHAHKIQHYLATD